MTTTARTGTRTSWRCCPVLAGYAVLFIQATTLVAALARAHGEGRLEDKLTQFAKPRLLIVDELGYLPFECAYAVPALGSIANPFSWPETAGAGGGSR